MFNLTNTFYDLFRLIYLQVTILYHKLKVCKPNTFMHSLIHQKAIYGLKVPYSDHACHSNNRLLIVLHYWNGSVNRRAVKQILTVHRGLMCLHLCSLFYDNVPLFWGQTIWLFHPLRKKENCSGHPEQSTVRKRSHCDKWTYMPGSRLFVPNLKLKMFQ